MAVRALYSTSDEEYEIVPWLLDSQLTREELR